MNKKEKYPMLLVFVIVFFFLLNSGSSWAAADTPESPGDTVSAAAPAENQEAADADVEKDKTKKESELYYEVTVTATRTKKDTFDTPKAVSVVDRKKIEEKAPNNVTELLNELPGVDVNGIGANQSRPIIRGLRGQRILLMEDGIRMNNSRRQQDFGEIPALVDISEVDRVEVVRGPASVLYGSDAIGGVVNIITRESSYTPGSSKIHGSFGYRYSSADKQNKGMASISGNLGKLGLMVSGNYRKASDYTAPAGTFGDITLTDDTKVNDTGVKDGGVNMLLSYFLSEKSQVSFKYEYYHSKDAGFGYIDPELYNTELTRIRILYPMQKVNKYTVKFENRQLGFVLADHIAFTGYHLGNERELSMNIYSPGRRPGAYVSVQSDNYTDVKTLGFRLELNKAAKTHTFTYGVDFFSDRSRNTDLNSFELVGYGPPISEVDTTPLVPNARYRSIGAFIQDDFPLLKRVSLILGLRYQNINAKTKDTPGLEGETLYNSTDQTVVGTANLLVGITDDLRFVLSLGRGFRSPNLIERFYDGVTPEGSAYQSRNTNLKAETSLNIDAGIRYRHKGIYLETLFFNNVISDGIRIRPTGQKKYTLDEYRNENVDKLRMRGVEAVGRVFFNFGLSTMANFTWIKSKDLGNSETPYVDTYSLKFNFNVRYDHPKKLFWLGYDLRINGNQRDAILIDNPLGDFIPGFTVHSISAGITLFRNSSFPQQLGIIIGNLTNELYSEFSNASFFRPAPKRHIVLTWNTRF